MIRRNRKKRKVTKIKLFRGEVNQDPRPAKNRKMEIQTNSDKFRKIQTNNSDQNSDKFKQVQKIRLKLRQIQHIQKIRANFRQIQTEVILSLSEFV